MSFSRSCALPSALSQDRRPLAHHRRRFPGTAGHLVQTERAAAVIGLGLLECEDHAFRFRVDGIRIEADGKFAQPVRVVHGRLGTSGRRRRVVHEEPAIAGEIRMECKSEETSLVVLGVQSDEAVG